MSDHVASDSFLLRYDNISVFRGEHLVLNRVSTTLNRGEALLLTGPNGAGKSTFLRVAAGLCPVTSGIAEHHPDAQNPAWLGHQDGLKPGLSLTDNLRLAATLGDRAIRPVLETLALDHLADYPVRLLSAGQKRRAALARIILRRAILWLLDEPASGLDDTGLACLGTLMTQHLAQGGGLVVTSHIPLPLTTPKRLVLPPSRAVPDTLPEEDMA